MFTINKSVSVWEQLVQLPFLNLYSRLLNAAMELDVFSQLCQPVTAEALAVHMGWHKANTEYLLSALVSIGFLNKTDGTYQNTAEVDRYLVKGKDEYLGGFLPFYMQEGMAPMDEAVGHKRPPVPATGSDGAAVGFCLFCTADATGTGRLPAAGVVADCAFSAGK